jgi:hypothetical protein
MSCCSTGACDPAALVVKPKVAWKMLACSNTRGYELLSAGALESFLDGRSRKILVVSINRYIARRLAAEREAATPPRPEAAGQARDQSSHVMPVEARLRREEGPVK